MAEDGLSKRYTRGVSGVVRRGFKLAQNQGIIALLKRSIPFAYNTIVRPFLPTGEHPHTRSTYVARDTYLMGDSLLPWDTPSAYPSDEEAALRESLSDVVNEGDTVVIVGGGYGISTVVAAKHVGQSGEVIVFEGSSDQVETVTETIELNQVTNRVEVNHAVVGDFSDFAADAYGESREAVEVDPADLPACDVLELDCEGTEREILCNMNQRPRAIIVETHGFLDVPEEEVRTNLEQINYKVIERLVEDESLGVSVLTAIQS